MENTNDFYQKKDKECFGKTTEFNNKKLNLNKLGQTPLGHYFDTSGYTTVEIEGKIVNKEKVIIEEKDREGTYLGNGKVELINASTNQPYTTNTIYIELTHYTPMKEDGEYGIDGMPVIPLYINYFTDGTIMVWNLNNKFKKRPKIDYSKPINDKGLNEKQERKFEKLYGRKMTDEEKKALTVKKCEMRVFLDVDEAYIYNNNYELIYNPKK